MFGFPAQNRPDNFRLTHNLLQSATFQIKYSAKKALFDVIGDVIAVLIGSFPVVKHLQQTSGKWQAVEYKTPLLPDRNKGDALQFSSDENSKVFVISEDAIIMTIAGQAYTNFLDIKDEFYNFVEAIIPLIEVDSFNRVSVRKINSLDAKPNGKSDKDPGVWRDIIKEVFNPELVAHISSVPPAKRLVSTVVNSRFEDGDYVLNLIYGLSPRIDEDGKREILLDIDLINSGNYSSLEEIKPRLLELNNQVFDIFIWSIPESFRESMKIIV